MCMLYFSTQTDVPLIPIFSAKNTLTFRMPIISYLVLGRKVNILHNIFAALELGDQMISVNKKSFFSNNSARESLQIFHRYFSANSRRLKYYLARPTYPLTSQWIYFRSVYETVASSEGKRFCICELNPVINHSKHILRNMQMNIKLNISSLIGYQAFCRRQKQTCEALLLPNYQIRDLYI